jgi:hypothetical protein
MEEMGRGSDSHERLEGFCRGELRNGDSGARLVLLAVATRLDKTDNMRLETVPGMSISAEKFKGDINSMVSH